MGALVYLTLVKHTSYLTLTAGVRDSRSTCLTPLDLNIRHNRTQLQDCESSFSSKTFSGPEILQSPLNPMTGL